MKDSPASDKVSDGDLYASKYNVSLARSQALLQSWLPAKPDQNVTPAEDDDDSDFKPMSEAAGLGAATSSDSAISDVLRRSRASNDKLLENLLGKKAAQARKKSMEAAKVKHTPSGPSKPAPLSRPAEDSEEEGEVGRVAAFSSRSKTRDRNIPAYTAPGGIADDILHEDAEPPDPREDLATVVEMVVEQMPNLDEDVRPKKRKAGSYLDEILAGKASKKKKKSKKKSATQ